MVSLWGPSMGHTSMGNLITNMCGLIQIEEHKYILVIFSKELTY